MRRRYHQMTLIRTSRTVTQMPAAQIEVQLILSNRNPTSLFGTSLKTLPGFARPVRTRMSTTESGADLMCSSARLLTVPILMVQTAMNRNQAKLRIQRCLTALPPSDRADRMVVSRVGPVGSHLCRTVKRRRPLMSRLDDLVAIPKNLRKTRQR